MKVTNTKGQAKNIDVNNMTFFQEVRQILQSHNLKAIPGVLGNLLKAGLGGKPHMMYFDDSHADIELKFEMATTEDGPQNVLAGKYCRKDLKDYFYKALKQVGVKPNFEDDATFKKFMKTVVKLSGLLLKDNGNADKILKYVHRLKIKKTELKNPALFEYLNQVVELQREQVAKIHVPEFPKKSIGFHIMNVLFALTISAFILALFCSLANIKPLTDMLAKIPMHEKISGVGEFFKVVRDFATKEVGPKKAIASTIGLGVTSAFVTGMRGYQKTNYLYKRDNAWYQFYCDFADAIIQVRNEMPVVRIS